MKEVWLVAQNDYDPDFAEIVRGCESFAESVALELLDYNNDHDIVTMSEERAMDELVVEPLVVGLTDLFLDHELINWYMRDPGMFLEIFGK